MFKINKIKLPDNGIIVFGARPGMGLSRITLKIANELAKSENVVFVSYQTYKNKLIKIITEQDKSISPHLTINTELKFFDYDYSQEMHKLIDNTSAKTIIVDNLGDMLGEDFDLSGELRDNLVRELDALAKKTNTRLILNFRLSRKLEYSRNATKPLLQDFTWSRNLIEYAEQIYSIYRPEYYGITDPLDFKTGDVDSKEGRVEIKSLKDEKNGEKEYVFYHNKFKF